MKNVTSAAKKLVAVGSMAVGLGGFGVFAGVGIAQADGTLPDSGSFDELIDIPDPDGVQGEWDDDGIQAADVRNSPNPR